MIKVILSAREKLFERYSEGNKKFIDQKRKDHWISKYIDSGNFVQVMSPSLKSRGRIDVMKVYNFLKTHIEQNSITEIKPKRFNTEKAEFRQEIKEKMKKLQKIQKIQKKKKDKAKRKNRTKKNWYTYFAREKRNNPKTPRKIKYKADYFYNLYHDRGQLSEENQSNTTTQT